MALSMTFILTDSRAIVHLHALLVSVQNKADEINITNHLIDSVQNGAFVWLATLKHHQILGKYLLELSVLFQLENLANDLVVTNSNQQLKLAPKFILNKIKTIPNQYRKSFRSDILTVKHVSTGNVDVKKNQKTEKLWLTLFKILAQTLILHL